MYERESRTIKKAECWRIDGFKLWCWRRPKSPLDSKEIKLVNPKGIQPWIFIGRADAEAEVPIIWPPDLKSWLTGKDSDAGKDWGQEEKRATEDEMVGWHHQLNGHESEQAPGIGDRQRSLACCSPWGLKESYTMEQLNWHLFSFPGGAVLKNLPAKAEDKVSIPGSGWSPGAGNGNPFQYSCLKNSMHRGAWQAIVHGVAKS